MVRDSTYLRVPFNRSSREGGRPVRTVQGSRPPGRTSVLTDGGRGVDLRHGERFGRNLHSVGLGQMPSQLQDLTKRGGAAGAEEVVPRWAAGARMRALRVVNDLIDRPQAGSALSARDRRHSRVPWQEASSGLK